jgi:hypothetical protein
MGSGPGVVSMMHWIRSGLGSSEEGELDTRADVRRFFDNLSHEWVVKFLDRSQFYSENLLLRECF